MNVTVKELKAFLDTLPEMDHYGDPHTVWVEVSGTGVSNEACELHLLNAGDLLIEVPR